MSTGINKGDQKIRWEYQMPLSSDNLGERVYKNLPPGIYSGFSLYVKSVSGTKTVAVTDGILEIADETAQVQAKCRTMDSFDVAVETSTPYIHAYWYWSPTQEWFVDWVALSTAKGTSGTPASQYVCLGKAEFTPFPDFYLSGFSFDDRQNAQYPTSATEATFTEDVQDVIAETLTAGPNMSITYYDLLGIIFLSAQGATEGASHTDLYHLHWPYDDHPQYVTTGGTANRQLTGGPWEVGEGLTISAGGFGYPYVIAKEFSPAGKTFDEYISDVAGDFIQAGANVSVTYNDIEDKIVISNPRGVDDPAFVSVGVKAHRGSSELGSIGFSRKVTVDPEEMGGNYWTAKPDMAVACSGSSSFSVYGYFYSVGGAISADAEDNMVQTCYRYNDSLNVWAQVTGPTPTAYGVRTAQASCDNVTAGWLIGGRRAPNRDSQHLFKYNPIADSWLLTGIYGMMDSGYSYANAFCINNLIHYIGGWEDSGYIRNFVQVYNMNTGYWLYEATETDPPNLPEEHPDFGCDFGGFLLHNTYWYFGGLTKDGSDPREVYDEMLRYNPNTYIWTKHFTGPPLALRGQNSMAINGYGYSVGGMSAADDDATNGPESRLNSNFEWDDYLHTWRAKADIPYSFSHGAGCEANGFGYNTQGCSASGSEMVALTYQYRNVSMYKIPGCMLRSIQDPFKIWAGLSINNRTADLPVWINVDPGSGSYWLYGKTNREGFYKPGQDFTILTAGADNFREYQMRVGLPKPSCISARGFYVQKLDMPQVVWAPITFDLNSYGYLNNGVSAGNTKQFQYRYDIYMDSWTEVQSMSGGIERSYCDAWTVNGLAYCFGGLYHNTNPGAASGLMRYDDYGNWWSIYSIHNFSKAGYGSFVLNGFGYIAAGNTFGGITDTVYKYDDSQHIFIEVAGCSGRRDGNSFEIEGYGYLCNGQLSANGGTPVERYNDALNIWEAMTDDIPLPGSASKVNCGSFDLQGRGYSIGGSGSAISERATEYSPVGDYWNRTTNPPLGMGCPGNPTFEIDNIGYILGFLTVAGTPIDSFYQFNVSYEPFEIEATLFTQEY